MTRDRSPGDARLELCGRLISVTSGLPAERESE